jgi:hypothetical protein
VGHLRADYSGTKLAKRVERRRFFLAAQTPCFQANGNHDSTDNIARSSARSLQSSTERVRDGHPGRGKPLVRGVL